MEDKSSIKTGVFGMVWMSMSSVATTVVNLLLTMFLARLLTAEDYGVYQAIAVLVGFADMLWQLGIGPALVQKKNLKSHDIITGNTLNIFLGLFIFAAINLFVSFWCDVFAIQDPLMLRAYSLVFVINTVMAVPKALLQRKCQFDIIAKSNVAGLLAHAVIAVILALRGFGAWALVISIIAQYLVQMIIILYAERISFSFRIAKNSVRELLVFGGGFTLTRVFNYIALQGDNFIVNKTMGADQLGYYGKAYNLLNYPANLVGQTIDQVLYPIMSKEQDNHEKLRRVYCDGTVLIGLAVAPITAVAICCRKELVLFVLGEKWISVVAPMAVMVAGLYFRTAYKLGNSLIRSLGMVYKSAGIQFMYAICVILGAYLGHFLSLTYVALGVTLAFVLNYFVTTAVASKAIGVSPIEIVKSWGSVLIYTALSFLIGKLVYSTVVSIHITNSFLILVISTVFDFSLFILAYIATHKFFVSANTHNFLQRILNALKEKITKRGRKGSR